VAKRKHQAVSTRFEPPKGSTYKAKRLTADSIKTEESPAAFDFQYTTASKTCEVDRLKEGRCASQLVFRKGRAMLQLCEGYGQPGDLVPVKDAVDAQEKSTRHCLARRGGAGMSEFVEPGRPRQQRGNPAWLAAGVAMGVMAAVLIKKRQAAPTA